MKKNISIVLATLFAFGAMVANTQAASAVSDFRKDVEAAKQAVQADPTILAAVQEVNSEDSEGAGDANGSSVAVDGEKPDDEIDSEIENEVETESVGMDQGMTGSMDASTSSESGN